MTTEGRADRLERSLESAAALERLLEDAPEALNGRREATLCAVTKERGQHLTDRLQAARATVGDRLLDGLRVEADQLWAADTGQTRAQFGQTRQFTARRVVAA